MKASETTGEKEHRGGVSITLSDYFQRFWDKDTDIAWRSI